MRGGGAEGGREGGSGREGAGGRWLAATMVVEPIEELKEAEGNGRKWKERIRGSRRGSGRRKKSQLLTANRISRWRQHLKSVGKERRERASPTASSRPPFIDCLREINQRANPGGGGGGGER